MLQQRADANDHETFARTEGGIRQHWDHVPTGRLDNQGTGVDQVIQLK
jgi:hypothetical protein